MALVDGEGQSVLDGVRQFGELGFNLEDVSKNFGIPLDVLRSQFEREEGDYYDAYYTGRLQSEAKLRLSVLGGAVNGSTPLIEKMIDYFKAADRDNLDIMDD